jgi:hypothetical protein
MVNSNRERKRVLFVEDHEDSWEIVAYYLEEKTLASVTRSRTLTDPARIEQTICGVSKL